MTDEWPRLPDPEEEWRLWRERAEREFRRMVRTVRRLRWLVALTATCMFLVTAIFAWYVLHVGDTRRAQLCATWYAGITQAPPGERIPTVLLDLYGAAECRPPLTPEVTQGG